MGLIIFVNGIDMNRNVCKKLAVVGLGLLSCSGAFGQDCMPSQVDILTPPKESFINPLNTQAQTVAVYGDTMLIGTRNPGGSTSVGAAYPYRLISGTWTAESVLEPSDATTGQQFGNAIAISGNTAIIGSSKQSLHTGAAYIFVDDSGWDQEAILVPSNPVGGNGEFGYSVAIDGDTAVVGAPYDGGGVGAAYVFTRSGTTWTQQAKLLADSPSSGANFGNSVAIWGDWVVVGSYLYDEPSGRDDVGAVYVFQRDGTSWDQIQTIDAWGTLSDYAGFGVDVAIWGDRLVVGAWEWNGSMGDAVGSAYVYKLDSSLMTDPWQLEGDPLVANDPEERRFFGEAVAIGPQTILISSDERGKSGEGDESVYVFRYDGSNDKWVQDSVIVAPVNEDFFGHCLALYADTAVVAKFENSDTAYYIYDLNCSFDCVADVNHDDVLSPGDFTAWIAAFNMSATECDQNDDGLCTPGDFTAWIANYNSGCL